MGIPAYAQRFSLHTERKKNPKLASTSRMFFQGILHPHSNKKCGSAGHGLAGHDPLELLLALLQLLFLRRSLQQGRKNSEQGVSGLQQG